MQKYVLTFTKQDLAYDKTTVAEFLPIQENRVEIFSDYSSAVQAFIGSVAPIIKINIMPFLESIYDDLLSQENYDANAKNKIKTIINLLNELSETRKPLSEKIETYYYNDDSIPDCPRSINIEHGTLLCKDNTLSPNEDFRSNLSLCTNIFNMNDSKKEYFLNYILSVINTEDYPEVDDYIVSVRLATIDC